jgi:hypothetical protein
VDEEIGMKRCEGRHCIRATFSLVGTAAERQNNNIGGQRRVGAGLMHGVLLIDRG